MSTSSSFIRKSASVGAESPKLGDRERIVNQLDPSPATYSGQHGHLGLNVRPGCLSQDRVAGPAIIETKTGCTGDRETILFSQSDPSAATYSAEDDHVHLHLRPGCLSQEQVADPVNIEEKVDSTGDRERILVNQFGSSPATYSAEDGHVRLHVRPGCLSQERVAGPVIIATKRGCRIVESGGCSYMELAVVDCHPSGSKFDAPLDLDFRVGESLDEEDMDTAVEEGLDDYLTSLRDIYKVRRFAGAVIRVCRRVGPVNTVCLLPWRIPPANPVTPHYN